MKVGEDRSQGEAGGEVGVEFVGVVAGGLAGGVEVAGSNDVMCRGGGEYFFVEVVVEVGVEALAGIAVA